MASHFDEARDKLNTGEKGGRVRMLMLLQFGVGDVPSTKRGRLRRCGLSTVGRGFSRASVSYFGIYAIVLNKVLLEILQMPGFHIPFNLSR